MAAKNIVILGPAASGKTVLVCSLKGIDIPTTYSKTIGVEAHPYHHKGVPLTLWDVGHYSQIDVMSKADGIIYVTTTKTDFTSDKPYVIVKNPNRSAKFDTYKILDELLGKF